MKLAACLIAASTLALALAGCSRTEEADGQALATAAPASAPAAGQPEAPASDEPEGSETQAPGDTESPGPSPSPSAAASPAAPAAVAAAATAPAGFAVCSACHSVKRGENGLGPSLAGIYGEKAAEVPGFEFSPAMKASGITWNDANLDKYLESPMAVVPGTKMAFAGLKDAAQRKAVIDYLKGV